MNASAVVSGRCENCGRVMPVWTPDAIIEAIRAWNDEHGRPPTSMDWQRAGRGHPTVGTVQDIFGRWRAAIIAAGLRPRTQRPYQWSREAVADALLDWKMKHGRWPTAHDWEHASYDHPNFRTVYARFHSWSEALRAAGKPEA